MNRVAIIYYDCVNSLGNNYKNIFKNIINGESGINNIKNYINKNEYDLYPDVPIAGISDNYDKYKMRFINSRSSSFLNYCMKNIIDNGLNLELYDSEDIGISIGSLSSNISVLNNSISKSIKDNYKNIDRFTMLNVLNNIMSSSIMIEYGLKGSIACPSTACATGNSSIGEGFKMIKNGEVK